MSRMFGNCDALESLNLSGWDTSKVETREYTFGGCWNLQTLTLGKNTLNQNIFDDVFYNDHLTWYYIQPGKDAENPLALKTAMNGELLITEYDCKTMAGTWSTDEEQIPEPEVPVALLNV